jgi:hypothetical protein
MPCGEGSANAGKAKTNKNIYLDPNDMDIITLQLD